MRRRALLGVASLAGLAFAAANPAFSAVGDFARGLRPGSEDDQTEQLNALLRQAARDGGLVVTLAPGRYRMAGIVVPDGVTLAALPGATRIVAAGPGPLVTARNAARIGLSGLNFEGSGGRRGDGPQGVLELRTIAALSVEDCVVEGGGGHGLFAEACGGRIIGNRISGAAEAGLYAVDSTGLTIRDNRVEDCGNGGILVHRWQTGEDGSIIADNRIARIGATAGGTGQNGNGINIYQAAGVLVSGNDVTASAFSAIRANAASDIRILGNRCRNSGETAIYSEFGFEGALVQANLIDGAANGILIVNFDVGGRLASVNGNLVRNLSLTGPYVHEGAGFGFGIAAEADTAITGNVIENAPKWGLMLGWGPYLRDITATGNIVRRAATGCVVSVVEGSGSALIADNLFSGCTAGAIRGTRWNDVMPGDLAAPGAAIPAHLTIEGNRAS